MTVLAALRVVRDVQRDRLSEEQREQLVVLLVATIAAVQIDGDPDDPWAAVALELRHLVAVRRPESNVIPIQRRASGRR